MTKEDYFQDADGNWRGKYTFVEVDGKRQAPDGGIAIKDVTHNNYNFAKDIRLIGFWLEYETTINGKKEEKTKHKFYELSRNDFVFSEILLTPFNEFDGIPQPFPMYNPVYKIQAAYQAKPGLFENWDVSDLYIQQVFLFSKYSNSPAHEPLGVLQAARFFPFASFTFFSSYTPPDESKPQFKFVSIRFDHRLDLNIDKHLEDLEGEFFSVPSVSPLAKTLNNFAGVFQDTEEATVGVHTQKIAFEKVEKPLIFEIASWGYKKDSKTKWDNIHWWGQQFELSTKSGKLAPSPVHISTPGAAHAIHCHWRWGGVLRNSSFFSALQQGLTKYGTLGIAEVPDDAEQFHGSPTSNSPLVDPDCYTQDLNFAIVKYKQILDPNFVPLNKLSTESFQDLFKYLGTPHLLKPEDISKGEDIVLWLSPTVYKDWRSKNVFSGVPLIHGLFFAHNPELYLLATGSRTEEYYPDSEKDIRRKWAWER